MPLSEKQKKLKSQMLSSFKFGLFKVFNLPLGFITGIKIEELTQYSAKTSVKYKYLNKNPFKSMYFAVLAMAAELSTGALALFSIASYKESIALLVIESHGKFYKKATGKITFVCEDGDLFKKALNECAENNTSATAKTTSKGFNEDSELVCEYEFTWSFKIRN